MSNEGIKRIVAPIHMCGCGTNHDAINAALRLARQNMKAEADGGDCALWNYSVAVAYVAIASQVIKAGLYQNAQDGGMPVDDDGFHRQAAGVVAERQQELDKKILAGFFKADEINKDVSKFVCEELKMGDALRPVLEEGPSPEFMQQLGFGVRELRINAGHTPSIDDILSALFGNQEGMKPN